MSPKRNLLDLDRQAMRAFFEEIGEKPFRGDQLFKWIHQQALHDFAMMTNFSNALRAKLAEVATIETIPICSEQVSDDGTVKWLFALDPQNQIETVFIPETNRGTLCVSSQVGCALNCSFCATGAQGFNRNLSAAQIISQVMLAKQRLSALYPERLRVISNVVMMGMGEPLLNFDAVVAAMRMMLDDNGYGLSKYRVTLSTSGVIPQMLKLKETLPVALAVSLHAPNDTLRNELVPLNRKYPLAQLMSVCRDYFPKGQKREVMFEYVMLEGVNDGREHALQLVDLLDDVPCKVNLIPFNPFEHTQYRCSSEGTMLQFQKVLQTHRIHTTIRKTRGQDIAAACGQLAGDFADRSMRRARWLRQHQAGDIIHQEN